MLDDHFKKKLARYIGMEIDCISVAEENGCTLFLRTIEGANERWDGQITIYDGGQECCEQRWMTCDDELTEHKGARLRGVELLESSSQEVENEDKHDCSFLRIDTTAGSFRLCMHNQHNGYYGGFDPSIRDGS